jgi:hypothetical protein
MGKGKVSARLPSYYATLLSYCSRGGDGAEGGFANARSGERLLLPATLSSRISPTVHAQVARMCAPLIRARVYRSGSGVQEQWKVWCLWKVELQEVPLGAENHSLESPNTTLTCQHSSPTHPCCGTFTCICPRTPCLPDNRGANFHTSTLKHVLVAS